jgi:hypothetical protein
MGLGDFTLDLVADPRVNAEAKRYRHLRIYEDERHIYTGLILRLDPSSDKVTIGGRLPTWRLGVDKSGSLIRDRTYLSGVSVLSNGDFSLGELYWGVSDASPWVVQQGHRRAVVSANPLKDDVLASTEPRDAPAGSIWRSEATVERLRDSIGRARIRTVYEGRQFAHPDLLDALSEWSNDSETPSDASLAGGSITLGPTTPEIRLLDSGWSDTSEVPGDIANTGDWLTIGPCTQPQYLVNGDFETGDFTNWFGNTGVDSGSGIVHWFPQTSYGTMLPYTGSYFAQAQIAGAGADAETVCYLENLSFVDAVPGQRFRLAGYVLEGGGGIGTVSGSAGIFLAPVPVSGVAAFIPTTIIQGTNYYGASPQAGQWKLCQLEYTVPPGIDQLVVDLLASMDPAVGGNFGFDDITLTRIGGNTCQAAGTEFAIVPHDTYEIVSQAFANEGMAAGQVEMTVTMTGPGKDPVTAKSNPVLPANTSLIRMTVTITPADGYTDAYITFNGADVTGDSVVCNYPVVTRTKGNTALVTAPRVDVVPEEGHDLIVALYANEGMTGGTVKFSVLLEDSLGNRPETVVESGTIDYQAHRRTLLSYSLNPPSGYDRATVSLVATDVAGASFHTIGKPTLTFADKTKWIFDRVTAEDAPDPVTLPFNTTAPAGSEKVHLELVAEEHANGWAVSAVSLTRQGVKTSVLNVFKDCLVDADTGLQLVDLGTFYPGDENLSHDWRQLRLTNAEALSYLARSGVAFPLREWRYTPDNKLHFGTAAQLFVDRNGTGPSTAPFILRPSQIEVLELPDVQQTSEEEVDEVLVIGATITDFRGRQVLITGSATRTAEGTDWNGHPSHRVVVVEESTMDTVAAANAWAAYILSRNNARQAVQLSLSDWRGYADGEFDVGDTIYPEDPESGLVGDTQMVDPKTGETCWPVPSRVLERTRKLGGGFRAEIRRENGSIYEIPDNLVLWERETSASVTVGDFLPEFAVDSQGLSPSVQVLKRLASMPR